MNQRCNSHPLQGTATGRAKMIFAVPLALPAALTAALLLTAAQPAAAQPGWVLSHQKISDTEGGFTGRLDDGDRFGSSAASLCDLDGDGVGDLAAGAIGDDDGGDARGAVWVLILDGIVSCDACDANCDGSVDLTDVEPFIELVLGSSESCDACTGDTNRDGSVDLTDVEGFIECLLG